MGRELDRLGARTLSDRQSDGAARAQVRLPRGRTGRARPDLPADREARHVGTQTRIRLSNAFGTKPVTFDGAFVGLQESGSAIVPAPTRA